VILCEKARGIWILDGGSRAFRIVERRMEDWKGKKLEEWKDEP